MTKTEFTKSASKFHYTLSSYYENRGEDVVVEWVDRRRPIRRADGTLVKSGIPITLTLPPDGDPILSIKMGSVLWYQGRLYEEALRQEADYYNIDPQRLRDAAEKLLRIVS